MPRRLLLADDSQTIQKVVSMIFPPGEYELTTVATGDALLETARRVSPELILLDTRLGDASGIDLCMELRRTPETASVPVLFLAGAFEQFDESAGRAAGGNDVIVKPFEAQQLVDKVNALLSAPRATPVETISPPAPEPFAGDQSSPFDFSFEPTGGAVEPPPLDIFAPMDEPPVPSPPQSFAAAADDTSSVASFFETTSLVESVPSATEASPAAEPPPADFLSQAFEPPPLDIFAEPWSPEPAEPVSAPPVGDPFATGGDIPVVPSAAPPTPAAEPFSFEVPLPEVEPVPAAEPFSFEEPLPVVEPTPSVETVSGSATFSPFEPSPTGAGEPAVAIEPEGVEPLHETVAPSVAEPTMVAAPSPAPSSPSPVAGVPLPLTEEQLAAVVSRISRDIIEKIAWEVVPDLAEILIREEIRKIKEG